jgi:hypothetical protein
MLDINNVRVSIGPIGMPDLIHVLDKLTPQTAENRLMILEVLDQCNGQDVKSDI